MACLKPLLEVNPYPVRLGLPLSPPELALPALPDEARLDLTHLPALAIDDERNREPDDALSLDGERLWVHIADVAALVAPGSPADLEACARGATLYLPEATVPMLPWEAAERLGLGLAGVSPALSFGLDLGPGGEVKDLEIAPSWVRVTRLTYGEAEARLEEEPLHGLYQLARRVRARREAQGAISLDLPEVKIRVVGDQVAIRPIPSLHSRELVAEAMLLAGETVARFALERGIPVPFATQDAPASDERPQQGDLAGMVALRRAFRPSEYSTRPGPNAGTGLAAYVQATSPLRRYLDLLVHQQLRAHLQGRDLLDPQTVLGRIGATAAVSGSLRQAERLSRQHWTLVYLAQNPGWRGQGVLVGTPGALLIPELDLDARVHLRRDLPLNSAVPVTLRGVNLPGLAAHWLAD